MTQVQLISLRLVALLGETGMVNSDYFGKPMKTDLHERESNLNIFPVESFITLLFSEFSNSF